MSQIAASQIGGCANFLATFDLFDHDGTGCLGLVKHLTMQAVDAFVRVDLSGGMDRLHRALMGAGLTRIAALMVPFEPVEHP